MATITGRICYYLNMRVLLYRARRVAARFGDRLGTRLQRSFFLYVAALFTVIVLIDAFSLNAIVGMRQKAFDLMVRNRLRVASPAGDILIVDIDEKSLAAMAPDYGRWPWPRQVLGEFVEKIETRLPRAIVFDILFSDADLFNPDSDAYFNEVIAATGNTWFPLVRLDPAQDADSALPAAKVPGSRRLGDSAENIAVILPYFAAIQDSGRVGFNNIWPDDDGIVREYDVRRIEHGIELPSLALAVARSIHPSLDAPDRLLLNWRGAPFTYRYVSFVDVFSDLQREHSQRSADEFAGKIVIIGSTAPSLFDLKGTAVSRQFPGVEILATAIDNLRNHDWLRVPPARLPYLMITLIILWGTAWAFYRHGSSGKLDRFYGLSQIILIAIAYAAINLENIYINLTGPVMFGFIYFSLARSYAFLTARVLDRSVVSHSAGSGNQARGIMLLLRFDLPTREEAALARLATVLKGSCTHAPSAEWISGRQQGLWRLLENTLVLCWRYDGADEAVWEAFRNEAAAVAGSVTDVLRRKEFATILPQERLHLNRAEGGLDDDHHDWSVLLGNALQGEGVNP